MHQTAPSRYLYPVLPKLLPCLHGVAMMHQRPRYLRPFFAIGRLRALKISMFIPLGRRGVLYQLVEEFGPHRSRNSCSMLFH